MDVEHLDVPKIKKMPVQFKVSPDRYREIKKLIEDGRYSTVSDFCSAAVDSFFEREKMEARIRSEISLNLKSPDVQDAIQKEVKKIVAEYMRNIIKIPE